MKKAFRIVLAGLFLGVIGLGWRWPMLAYCMFLNVLLGIILCRVKGGRYACGNTCPRGAFYGLLPRFHKGRIPDKLRRIPISFPFMALVLGGLIWWVGPNDLRSWGVVFYGLLVTTFIVGIAGAVSYRVYFWCALCPMGKIYRWVGRPVTGPTVGTGCVSCGQCDAVCPMSLPVRSGNNPDCLQCGACVEKCPKGILRLK